jgi:hypothetical protein
MLIEKRNIDVWVSPCSYDETSAGHCTIPRSKDFGIRGKSEFDLGYGEFYLEMVYLLSIN